MNAALRMFVFIALCAYALCAGPACSHLGPGTVVGDCGKEVSAELLPSIESALVSGSYIAELTDLAGRFGICLIRNGVNYIKDQALVDKKFGAMDRNTMVKIDHAHDYLERTAVK